MEIRQNTTEIDLITRAIEQRIVAGSDFDGTAPSLSTLPVGEQNFVPFYEQDDGLYRYKNPGPLTTPASVSEGDHGGLFTFATKKPIWLIQFLADFGSDIPYMLSIVLSKTNDIIPVFGLTGRYATQNFFQNAYMLHPGDRLHLVTTGGTGAMWARIYATLDVPGLL